MERSSRHFFTTTVSGSSLLSHEPGVRSFDSFYCTTLFCSLLSSVSLSGWFVQAERFQLRQADLRRQTHERTVHARTIRDGHVEGKIVGRTPTGTATPRFQTSQTRQDRCLDDGQRHLHYFDRPLHLRKAEKFGWRRIRQDAGGRETNSVPTAHRT